MVCPAPILLFARYPVPGKVKTRLIPALGPEGAAQLHRRMTGYAVGAARAACAADRASKALITVCCTGGRMQDFRAWLGADLQYAFQSTGDLGARMHWAFKTALGNCSAVICIGSDVPEITPTILRQAHEKLTDHDVVLGPATDGGYYLIGMKRLYPELFASIDWGTEHVYKQTHEVISALGLLVAELPVLSDVDRPEDLALLRTDPRFSDAFSSKPLLSVIIPTLNEANNIKQVLARLQTGDCIEIIVVDGHSTDATRELAAEAGVRVLEVSGNRAAQQNAGAAEATGQLLLFLHADTLPPEGYADMIRAALADPAIVAGAFRFLTDGSGILMRLVERTTNFRSSVLQTPYGDQGLFMEKRVFNEMGGFAPLPIMEDLDLVRRLRQRGRIVTLSKAAITSARRWQQLGVIRTTIINQLMLAGFFCGVPLSVLERFYKRNRKTTQPEKAAQLPIHNA